MLSLMSGEPFSAELSGLDLIHPDPSLAADLRALLSQYRVLVFRDVSLTPRDQVNFLSLFGRVAIEMVGDAAKHDPAKLFGRVSFVTTKPHEYISTTSHIIFHSDFAFYSDGAARAISLHAIEVGAEDPTIFADMGMAARRMPPALLDKLRALKVVKCSNHMVDNVWPCRMSNRVPGAFYGNTASIHPCVIRHPSTGEETINICQEFSSHILGWSDAESTELFQEVARWQYDEENLFRHRWRKGDLIVWDNVATQHARETLTPGVTRHLQRVLIHPWDAEELEQRTGAVVNQTQSLLMPAN